MWVQTDDSARTSPSSLTTYPSNAAVEKRAALPGGRSASVATSSQKPSPATRSSEPPIVGVSDEVRGASETPTRPAASPAAAPMPPWSSWRRESRHGRLPAGSGAAPGGSADPDPAFVEQLRPRSPPPAWPSPPRRRWRRRPATDARRPGARRGSARTARLVDRAPQTSVESPSSAALRRARYWSTLALPLVMPISCAVSATDSRWRKRSSSTRR